MNQPDFWLNVLGNVIIFIALNFIWQFLKYEFTLHCGRKYMVTVNFKRQIDNSKGCARYAISAFSEDEAIVKALKKWSSTGPDGSMRQVESYQAIKAA